MKMKSIGRASQKGFTLIELIVVVAIVGILAAIIATAVRGTSDPANAEAIRGSAKQFAKAVGYMHVQLGTGTDAMNNALPSSGLSLMDVLMVGDSAVATAYRDRYNSISMRAMEGDYRVITRPAGSTPGAYMVQTYPVQFVNCTAGKICTQYSNVPTDTLAEIARKSGMSTFAPATAVTTGPVRYTAAANGYHTVTLEAVP